MSRLFYHVMQDNLGNLLFDVTGTMRLAGSGTLATIYGDEALTVVLPNPMTNHPSFGSFKCFLGAGDYDFYMAKGGYTFETLTGVQGHGTMAQQNANAVAITGGSATLATLTVDNPTLIVDSAQHTVGIGGAPQPTEKLHVQGLTFLNGRVGLNSRPQAGATAYVEYTKAGTYALLIKPSDNDTGPGQPIRFLNTAGTDVGMIITSATTTTYATTSDARLKHAIAPLTGALDRIRALKPVSFLWNADGSPGEGFLAHELMQHIPAAVTGTPHAVDAAGNIQPQEVDHSKLVPWLAACCQTLAQQVEGLTARLAALEVEV
jgi:hypothetical protein